MAQEEEALIVSPDSAFNPFTLKKYNQSCTAAGMLVFTPSFDPTFPLKVKKFIESKNPNYSLNKVEQDWQKLEIEDWRIPYSYMAARTILWLKKTNYNGGKIKGVTGTIEFYAQSGELIADENSIDIFQVTSECEFTRVSKN